MKQADRQSDRGGFTLMEVLVVVAIIGILMGLVSGGLVMAKRKAERIRMATLVADIKLAWDAYRLEYQHFPASAITEMDALAVGILRGNVSADNPQGSSFLDFRSGATEQKDMWGNRFQVALDTDYDEQVDVPGHGTIPVSVAVWSKGRDEVDPDDDICSWEK